MVEPCFNWSDAAVARLKELAEQGYSSSQIANELGAPSRNSVIGKAAREGIALARNHTPASVKVSQHKAKKARTFGTLPFMHPKSGLVSPGPSRKLSGSNCTILIVDEVEERKYRADEPLPGSRMLGIDDLRSYTCRWPLGDPRAPDFAYCGADTALGRSYCPCHHRMAYASQIEPYVKPAPASKPNARAIFKAAIAAEMAGAANG